MKPSMFVGSSVEGLQIAEAIQTNLAHTVDCHLWTQGVFGVSGGTLEELIRAAGRYDFATFILSPDDVTMLRNEVYDTARDNVIFELGIFAGALGKNRVFFVTPDQKGFHIPTDLLGITPAKYIPGSHEGNHVAALGVASLAIKVAVNTLITPSPGATNLNGEWRGYWEVENSDNFPVKNEFTTKITHIGNSIKSSFNSEEVHYGVTGTIHRGHLITGIWGNPEGGAAYFGPFQLVISPKGDCLKGKWSGFKQDLSVEAGHFEWKRV
jgi:hypothetical protein